MCYLEVGDHELGAGGAHGLVPPVPPLKPLHNIITHNDRERYQKGQGRGGGSGRRLDESEEGTQGTDRDTQELTWIARSERGISALGTDLQV